MAEFSSFNGYTVKDTVARNIAKGRNQAVAFNNYATMIEALNAMEKDEYKTGQNIYIGVVGVPDLWVYSVEGIKHTFDYVSDDDVVAKLTANTTIQAGYFKLAMLEGQKVDMTTYDQKLAEHTADIDVLNQKATKLEGDMGNCVFSTEADGAYVTYTLNGETVKKKLGSGKITISDYRITFSCAGKGNDTDGINRNANSNLTLDVTDYDELYIGSYECKYDSDHAGIGDSYATLSVTVDGTAVTLNKSGTTLDVSEASEVVIKLNLKNAGVGSAYGVSGSVTISEIVLDGGGGSGGSSGSGAVNDIPSSEGVAF